MSVGSFSDFEPRPGEVHFSLNCGHAGSCKERENLAGDAKGKGPSGPNRKAESTDAPERGGLLRNSEEAAVMVVERRGQVIDDEIGPTGNGRSPKLNGRRQPSIDGTSRMMREYQVRICERLRVKFPGPTRQSRHFDRVPLTSGLPPLIPKDFSAPCPRGRLG